MAPVVCGAMARLKISPHDWVAGRAVNLLGGHATRREVEASE